MITFLRIIQTTIKVPINTPNKTNYSGLFHDIFSCYSMTNNSSHHKLKLIFCPLNQPPETALVLATKVNRNRKVKNCFEVRTFDLGDTGRHYFKG